MKKLILYIVVMLVGFVGCSKKPADELPQGTSGELRFAGFTVQALDMAGVATKVETQHPLEIIITDSATGVQVVRYPSHLDPSMPLTTVLPVGKYRVAVSSAAKLPSYGVGFDMPQYDADTVVEILPLKVVTIGLNCKQVSCGVDLRYSEMFKLCFPDGNYYTEVFSSYGHKIDFKDAAGAPIASMAHFKVSTDDMSLYYVLHRTSADGAILMSDTTAIQDESGNVLFAKKQTNYHVTVDVKVVD